MTQRPIKFRAWYSPPGYSFGSDGSVWSHRSGKPRRLKTYLDQDGYPTVVFVYRQKRTVLRVHRALSQLFLSERPTPRHQVNHKNGVRTDNRIKNLEWVTSRENTLHGWRVNGRKQSLKARLRASKQMSEMNAKRYAA